MNDQTIRFDDGPSYEIMAGRWSVLVGERFLVRFFSAARSSIAKKQI